MIAAMRPRTAPAAWYWTAIVLGLLLLVLLAGCSGVQLSAEYSGLLDRTAALSAETAARAERGELSEADMRTALSLQAAAWQKFRDARDGKDGRP
jgi:hypothetical protein